MGGTEQIGAAWRRASQRIDRRDARRLLEHVGACTHADLIAHPERELSTAQAAQFADLLVRREAGEPLAYLLGSAFFKGLEFTVSPAVLIPRPDTEVLVDEALKRAQAFAAPRIVDLGTGSGIIAILLARLCPSAAVSAVEVSAAALECARVNARRHRVDIRFLEGNWFDPLAAQRFDLIVSNPPYVADGDPHLQQNGLPFEPQDALSDGVPGGDGMACIRTLIQGARKHLLPGAWLLIEHGYDQAVEVRNLLRAAGFADPASWRDGAAIERVSGGRHPIR
ncbi:MAG: peptide chain release factor N(5)-glutamine methyltransferase [Propionivibrio sp.]|uniref:peptide chain release factor N(5)-glutamine methyltransferase n=1 Tax=Propionivibrio sp. TaxID=2212460 RepID=UPI001A427B87|nr:peptide chain release factor N(5)-glutamine methyltransferase [Propionivibrio sp.]MBL8413776.1 peptide chain release factor N(5)-glutamine methyltransferase [Propionivibrio sp.]